MNKLEKLSLHSALKIKEPTVNELFFPVVSNKYICIFSEHIIDSRKYNHLSEVVSLITPFLKDRGISILDISESNAPGIEGTLDFKSGTQFGHRCFLIKNAELVCCPTSLFSVLSGVYDVPCVTLYSDIHPDEDVCYWGDKSKRLNITPDIDNIPSHSYTEAPKTINKISPLDVAKSILSLLKIENDLDNLGYLHMGSLYSSKVIEVIPDFIPSDHFLPKSILNLRFDYHPDYKFLSAWAKGKNLSLFLPQDKPIDPSVLSQIRGSLKSVFFNLTGEFDLNYLSALRRVGISPDFFCDDEGIVNKVRLLNIDLEVPLIEKKSKKDLDSDTEIGDNTFFKSGKLILSNGKKFQSKANWITGIDFDGSEQKVIDSSDFWEDLDYYIIYTKNDT